MLRLSLALLVLVASGEAAAQRVPGRDLLTYPLGLAAEPASVGGGAASGLWNAATGHLTDGERGRIAAAALSAPIDLAFSGQVLHGAVRVGRGNTLSINLAHASVSELTHTETDPQSVGPDIPYWTWVVSAGLSRRVHSHVTAGAAVRWHAGRVFERRGNALIVDGGIIASGLTRHDVRAALSTFLYSPRAGATPSIAGSVDARVIGPDSTHRIRAGFGATSTLDAVSERYPYVDARYERLTVRGGPVHISAYGASSWRTRLAVLVTHAGYTVSVVREDNPNGLAATYQLGVANVFR